MKLLKVALIAGLALLAVSVTRADGVDPVLNLNGGHGSPNCFQPGGTGFVGTTGMGGTFTIDCNNNSGTDLSSFQFDIQSGYAPGGLSVTLGGLLAPFTGELSVLNWTASCTNGPLVDVCTATQSPLMTEWESYICSNFLGGLCGEIAGLSESQIEALQLPALAQYGYDPCQDPYVYVVLGIIPGCDADAGGTSNAGGTNGDFVSNAPAGITPPGATVGNIPEPSSLALLLVGLSGMPLLRRRFGR